jgi:hypothetical protein
LTPDEQSDLTDDDLAINGQFRERAEIIPPRASTLMHRLRSVDSLQPRNQLLRQILL